MDSYWNFKETCSAISRNKMENRMASTGSLKTCIKGNESKASDAPYVSHILWLQVNVSS